MPTQPEPIATDTPQRALDCIDDVVRALLGPINTGDALRAVVSVLDQGRTIGIQSDYSAVERIKAATATVDPVFRESALAYLTGDLSHYVQVISLVRNVMDLAPLDGINQIYWSILRQLFLMRLNTDSVPRFGPDVLFPFYCSLVKEIAGRFDLRPTVWKPEKQDSRKVVMVTNQFLSLSHQPSRDLLAQAAALQEHGDFDVTILNTNMMPDRYYSPFVPPFAANIEPSLDGEQTLSFEGRAFKMISSTSPGVNAAKVAGFINAVDKINPEAVISIGGSVVIADLLSSSRPSLCLQTTSGFVVSPASLILDFGGGAPPAGDDHYARAWRPFRLGLSLRQERRPVERREAGIPEDAFAMLVIGNRLDYEVTPSFLDLLHRFVAQQPAAFVIFAGSVTELPGRLANHPISPRARCLGYVHKIDGLAEVCDVYVNPLRTGGGASAMQALAAGLPIVSLAAGDVAGVAGPAFCVPDPDAFVARLLSLFHEPEIVAAARLQAGRRYAELENEGRNCDLLVSYIGEAQQIFTAREGFAG
jgi:hypothetical protein